MKIVGFIVIAEDDVMCAAKAHDSKYETLWFGTHATLFETRRQAYQAIARTQTYRKNLAYDWPWMDKARVVRVIGIR